MSPRLDFSDWWAKDTRKGGGGGTPVVVKMENPNYSVVEIQGSDSAFRPVDKTRGRNKNAKQVTWVLLLKAHRAVGCLTWLAALFWSLLGSIKKRLSFTHPLGSERLGRDRWLFTAIKLFLAVSLLVLGFEIVAYLRGWHYFENHIPTSTLEIQSLLHLVYVGWLRLRADYIAPPIKALSKFCIVLFLIQSVDRLILCLGCFWIKYKKIKPRFDEEPFRNDDAEGCGYVYPMVLVQIPMCNEREVSRADEEKETRVQKKARVSAEGGPSSHRTRASNRTSDGTPNVQHKQPSQPCSISDQVAKVRQSVVDALTDVRQFRSELEIKEHNLEAALLEIDVLGEKIMGISKLFNINQV